MAEVTSQASRNDDGLGLGPVQKEAHVKDKLDDEKESTIEISTKEAEAIKILASGVRKNDLADLEKAKTRVKELVHNQDVLRESIQQEITNLNEYKLTDDITAFVSELRLYHTKLLNAKKDIQYINEKVTKMNRRVGKLKANKEKQEQQAEERKRKELELQKHLTAKPATDSFSS
eukprot:Seg2598.2 transcript_id=Seg2598.2/GoldUCD/mRNA.D3Y31 product="Biogenesis of lysosome-related organelles complex 1 subunit 6" protein_id=Seg2598.2/GoldUCD/D3Y31